VATTKRSTGSPRKRANEVIEAAASVFALRGYHGATTQEIADLLRIRQATLYYYFASKDTALELVCQRGVEGFIERANEVATSSGSAPDKIANLIRYHLKAFEEKQPYVKTFLNERKHLSDDARKKIGRLSRRYESIVQNVFETGVKEGSLRKDLNCRLATLGMLGVCNSAAEWYGKEPGITLVAMTKHLTQLISLGSQCNQAVQHSKSKR